MFDSIIDFCYNPNSKFDNIKMPCIKILILINYITSYLKSVIAVTCFKSGEKGNGDLNKGNENAAKTIVFRKLHLDRQISSSNPMRQLRIHSSL